MKSTKKRAVKKRQGWTQRDTRRQQKYRHQKRFGLRPARYQKTIDFNQLYDLRFFKPYEVNYDLTERPSEYTDRRGKRKQMDRYTQRIGFYDPKNAVVCRRRRDRKRSLFAKRKIGKGRKVTKYRKRNENSKLRC